MKKMVIIFLLSSFVLFFIVRGFNSPNPVANTSSPDISESDPNYQLLKDQQKIEARLDQKSIRLMEWKDARDFSRTPREILTKENASAFFKMALLNIPKLNDCLKKDYCGMEKRNSEDPYFNYNKTPGHIYLERFLEILKEATSILPGLAAQIEWDLIKDLTQNGNDQVRLLALELLSEKHHSENNLESLIPIAEDFKGEAKALALVKLSSRLNSENKGLFLDSLEKSFAENDNDTVMSIVSRLGSLSLEKPEIEHISKNLCHLKENELNAANWKMIRYDLSKLNVDIDQICN